MKTESHLKLFEEDKRIIYEWVLRIAGLEAGQRTVGLHASRAIIELLSAYLHERGLLSIDAQLNHRWFKSLKSAPSRLAAFPDKEDIVRDLVELEILCEKLAYGSPKSSKEIEDAIKLFNILEDRIQKLRKR